MIRLHAVHLDTFATQGGIALVFVGRLPTVDDGDALAIDRVELDDQITNLRESIAARIAADVEELSRLERLKFVQYRQRTAAAEAVAVAE